MSASPNAHPGVEAPVGGIDDAKNTAGMDTDEAIVAVVVVVVDTGAAAADNNDLGGDDELVVVVENVVDGGGPLSFRTSLEK